MKAFFSALWAAFGLAALGDAPITSLTTGTSVKLKTDFVPYVDVADKTQARTGTTKKISPGSLFKSMSGVVNVVAAGATGDGSTDDTSSINTALGSGSEVVFPSGYTFNIAGQVTVPDGVHVHINGTITGSGNITCSGSVTMDGGGSFTMTQGADPRKIKVLQGTAVFRDLHFNGTSGDHPWCVIIYDDGTGKTVDSFTADGLTSSKCGYLVAREGRGFSGGTVKRAIITRCIAIDTAESDGITWNDTTGTDSSLLIDGCIVDGVTYSGTGFNGFGIAIAGYGTLPAVMNNSMLDAVVSNCTVRRCFSGIHAEYTKRLRVSGNTVSQIDPSYTPNVSTPVSAIDLYGVWDGTVNGNSVSEVTGDMVAHAGIGVGGGSSGSSYVTSARNIYVIGNTLRNASIAITTTPQTTTANGVTAWELSDVQMTAIENNTIHNGGIYYKGRGTVAIRGNNAMLNLSKAGATGTYVQTALYINPAFYFDTNFDSRYRFQLVLENNNCRDEFGNSSFAVSSALDDGSIVPGNQRVIATGNNFGISSSYNRESAVNRTHYITGSLVPYGPEFVTGDLLINTAGSYKAIVTAGGTQVPGADTYQVYNSATGLLARQAGNTNNFPGTHIMGQKLTLTYSGGSTNVIVQRIYNDGSAPNGGQVIEVVSPTTGAICNLSGVGSGTISATYPITVTSY